MTFHNGYYQVAVAWKKQKPSTKQRRNCKKTAEIDREEISQRSRSGSCLPTHDQRVFGKDIHP